jgi:hypothetical protein
MADILKLDGTDFFGELALEVPVGTQAAARDRMIDAALTAELSALAQKLGAVLVSSPHKFAKPVPGKDAEGNTVFSIRGRREGEQLLPNHGKQNRPDARKRYY